MANIAIQARWCGSFGTEKGCKDVAKEFWNNGLE
jgi:hypothetical protein